MKSAKESAILITTVTSSTLSRILSNDFKCSAALLLWGTMVVGTCKLLTTVMNKGRGDIPVQLWLLLFLCLVATLVVCFSE